MVRFDHLFATSSVWLLLPPCAEGAMASMRTAQEENAGERHNTLWE
jgi:hypothetical protein